MDGCEDKILSEMKKRDSKCKLIATKNICQEKLTDPKGQYMLESLLSLLMISEEVKLSNLVKGIHCFKLVFSMQSAPVTRMMENSTFFNEQTLDVKSLRWNKTDSIISFGSVTSQLSPQKILDNVEKMQLKKASKFRKFKAFWYQAYAFINNNRDE
jgi:hypothetical protein